MTLRTLPEMAAPRPRRPVQWDMSPEVLARWESGVRFEAEGDNVLNIFGVIGDDWFSDSITPSQVQRRLQAIGQRDVVVNINSPGGDFFDGQAIFNMLRLHQGAITTRILGVAASAASVIAMAGDRIEMPAASWMMIHNTWTIAIGDRNVLADVQADLAKFDQVSAELYAARTGGKVADIAKMMDAQTFMAGNEAKDKGFADAVIDPVKSTEGAAAAANNSLRRLEVILQRAGVARSERRALLKELLTKPGAGQEDAKPSAGEPATVQEAELQSVRSVSAALDGILATLA